MTSAQNVIKDYSQTDLTLRQHSIAFLCKGLTACCIVTCEEAMSALGGLSDVESAGVPRRDRRDVGFIN